MKPQGWCDDIFETYVYDFRLFKRDWRTVKDNKIIDYWQMQIHR